jgi:uncharacterized membrane protein YphA (DoxX/SURF4 family)
MLSLFPSLLSFEMLAPFLLRVTLGAVLIYWAYGRVKMRGDALTTSFGLLEGIIGILLVIGLLTQLAALVAVVIFLVKLAHKVRSRSFFTNGINYYFILLIISLALIFLGAGAFAIDVPL